MMLLSAPHSAEKFTAPISGLRSLLVVPDGARGGVVTRAVVASRGDAARCCGGDDQDVKENRSDGTSIIEHNEDIKKAREEEDMKAKQKEEGDTEEEDEEEGCWVSYGRRFPRRRLPPPIPSLVARGALRRTRTDDGRLVIRIVPVVRPECIRSRRRGGRLTIQLVEHEDDSPMMAPPLPPLISAREDGVGALLADDDTTAPAGEGVNDVQEAVDEQMILPVAVPPPRVPSMGCFEDVFKYYSIRSSSLHQMPSLRMVH